jgi:hypothetical protein
MKYICFGYMDEAVWQRLSEGDRGAFLNECLAYDEHLRENRHMVGGEALQSATTAVTLRWEHGRVSITDGPFIKSKEHLGGILILEASDLNRAIQLMSKHPGLRFGGGFEVRPVESRPGCRSAARW